MNDRMPEDPSQRVTYRSYLLRLWKAGAAASEWRASIENPHTGERLGFASLERLFVFLMEQTDLPERIS